VVEATKMIAATTITQALEFAVKHMGRPDLDVLIIPHALLTLPFVQKQKQLS
jgi:hypothetical protein